MGMPMASDDWRNDASNALFDAVLTLQTRDEAAAFFRDLLTFHELGEMSQRWAVARLLAAGLPYRQIAELTSVSTATITRISQWLQHGTGGYRLVLEKTGPAAGGP
jgi:TrpR-related protein YerC/YecD